VEPEIEDQLARMALKLDPQAGNPLDHQYTHLVKWSDNSKYILLKTYGHTGERYKIRNFLAVYDLGRKSLSADLNKINAD
jgi:hypothetical protein